jgi:hypothetical protein
MLSRAGGEAFLERLIVLRCIATNQGGLKPTKAATSFVTALDSYLDCVGLCSPKFALGLKQHFQHLFEIVSQ